MAKLKYIRIKNYRSINEVEIKFPLNQPVILIGENNSGKSNILRAIDLMFGETYPKYKEFDNHDYYGRNGEYEIYIEAGVELSDKSIKAFILEKSKNKETNYFVSDKKTNYNVKNELRQQICTILINSQQTLEYQLSYSSKYTLLSKLTKAFHEKLVCNKDREAKLKDFYTKIINTFLEVEEFNNFKNNMSSINGQFIQNMNYQLKIDFSAYDPSNYFKNLQIHPFENEEVLNFDELGSGQKQILALSFAHAYAKFFKNQNGLILLIDEPEAHLHPIAQKWLAKSLFSLAKDGLSIVITTHSPYFIDLNYFESFYLVKKKDNQTIVKNKTKSDLANYCKEKGADKSNEKTIIPFYYKSSTSNILKGFFAKKIILVEGMTEELALPIYLEKVGMDLLKEGIDIISVNGKGELAKWWRFFTLFEIPCYVIFDNDSNDDKKTDKRKDALKSIGIKDEELDVLLNSDAWNIGDKFCIFGKDFEDTLKKTFESYEVHEEDSKKEFGDSKPLIARDVAQKIINDPNVSDESWAKFKEMAEKIRNLS